MQAGPCTSISFTSPVPDEMQWTQDADHSLRGRVTRPQGHRAPRRGAVSVPIRGGRRGLRGRHTAPRQACPGLSVSSSLSHTRHIHLSSRGCDDAGLADQTPGDTRTLEMGLGQI